MTPRRSFRALASALLFLAGCAATHAAELHSVSPITDRVLRLHFVEGKAFHETLGGNGSDSRGEDCALV
jgi:hypothetical protein